jgi:hypothetical protein
MGVIVDKIRLKGLKGEKKVDALYNTGASFSFITRKTAEKLGSIEKLPDPMEFETAREGDKISVKESITLDFYIEGIRLSDEFFIIEDLYEEVIIGAKTMQAWRLKLDFAQDRVLVDQRMTRLMLK